MKVNAVADAEVLRHCLKRGDEGATAGEVESPVDAGGEGVSACSSSARERRIQSMRLLASMRQTENMRSCCSTGRMGGVEDAGPRPPMRAIFASTLKSLRHSLRRYSLVTMVLPPVRRPWPMMRLETAMRSFALALRVCWSPKSDGVSCMRTWKPRMPASVA